MSRVGESLSKPAQKDPLLKLGLTGHQQLRGARLKLGSRRARGHISSLKTGRSGRLCPRDSVVRLAGSWKCGVWFGSETPCPTVLRRAWHKGETFIGPLRGLGGHGEQSFRSNLVSQGLETHKRATSVRKPVNFAEG